MPKSRITRSVELHAGPGRHPVEQTGDVLGLGRRAVDLGLATRRAEPSWVPGEDRVAGSVQRADVDRAERRPCGGGLVGVPRLAPTGPHQDGRCRTGRGGAGEGEPVRPDLRPVEGGDRPVRRRPGDRCGRHRTRHRPVARRRHPRRGRDRGRRRGRGRAGGEERRGDRGGEQEPRRAPGAAPGSGHARPVPSACPTARRSSSLRSSSLTGWTIAQWWPTGHR